MGKPTSKSSKASISNHNNSSTKSKKQMKTANLINKSIQLSRKKRKKLRKAMARLREESITSNSTCSNVTVIEVKDTPLKRKATEDIDNASTKTKMPKLSNGNNSCIIIDDGECLQTPKKVNSTPLHSSTPISTKTEPPTCLNISNLTNNISKQNVTTEKELETEITDLTKEINKDSYLTIDLTTETTNNDTVIDLVNTPNNTVDLVNDTIDLVTMNNPDCAVVSVSETNLSMSGDSEVTVLNQSKWRRKKDKKMQRFASGIANLNASEKGRLLELITEKILGGNTVSTTSQSILKKRAKVDRGMETAEDTYIREVILGEAPSRNSIGSNIYNPQKEIKNKSALRMIVIDGSNVAMQHSRGRQFSVKGLKICIDYFLNRGHIVKAFVPRFRCKFGKSSDPRLLDELERLGLVVYTPSREVQGKMITSYDDRYIVQCAAEFDGIIVSGDNYRDLLNENPRWRRTIETRLLQFTWVDDMIMFPRDPLGRYGPTLEEFLRHS